MAKAAPRDPVTRYATAVVAGSIIAGRLVRLACARHLDDLARQKEKGLEWRPAEAQKAIEFFPECLCLPEETDVNEDVETDEDPNPAGGTPFVLTEHQQFIVGSLFGWFAIKVSPRTGARRVQHRFRLAYFESAKGSGKSPLFAGILLFILIRVRGAQLFCAGVTKEQARDIPFADCVKMLGASPALQQLITHTGNNLAVKSTGSFIRPISAEKRGLDGKRVQGAIVEELHEHRTAVVVLKVRAGIKGRRDALILLPTNSGFDKESICWEYHEYSRQILEGTLVNETWFAFVCHLDACDRCRAAGKLQPSDDCAQCDDWKVEGPHWLKANPNLGVSLSWDYLREQVREAIAIPSSRNMVRRLNFCQWTNQATVWITPEQWAACATPLSPAAFRASLAGRECYLGIDLSDKIDLSSVVCLFPRALTLEAAGRSATDASDPAAAPPITCAIDVLPFFWMPEKTLARRAQEDNIPYVDWARDGFVITTPGSLIDHDAIVEFIVAVLAVEFRIRGTGIDQAGAAGVVSKLQRTFGDEIVTEIPQGFRSLSEPSKLLEALVLTANVTQDGNPAMAWCMGNLGKEENAWREIRPVKLAPRKRIDGGVALIDAIKKLTQTPAAATGPQAEWI